MGANRGKHVFKNGKLVLRSSIPEPSPPSLRVRNRGRPLKPGLWVDRVRRKKASARKMVRYAVRTGKLVKPKHCEYVSCQEAVLDAHHVDYDDPLEVLWLCRKHHNTLHAYAKSN